MELRKRRTRGHVIADVGVRLAEYIVAKAGYTSVQAPLGGDYGVDIYVFTFNRFGYSESGTIRIQVRATEQLVFASNGTATVRVDTRHLRQWLTERDPVLLVVFDAASDRAYWIDVQRAFAGRAIVTKSVTISLVDWQQFDVESVHAIAQVKNRRLRRLGESPYED